jgi:hypothetical protein
LEAQNFVGTDRSVVVNKHKLQLEQLYFEGQGDVCVVGVYLIFNVVSLSVS